MTQMYLVLHERGADHCGISIEPAGKMYARRMECWAIRTADQVKFTRFDMPRMFKGLHLMGRFEDVASYALSFDEMYSLLEKHMGPCDRIRCLQLEEDWNESDLVEKRRSSMTLMSWWEAVWGVLRVTMTVLGRSLRLLLVAIVAFLVAVFAGRNK